MVEDSSWSIQGLPKLDTFVFNTKIKDVFLPPYSFSLNFENSYIDPVSKSAELIFDVRDINGDILEELQESGFSAIVEEPKNATVNIARKAVSQLCVTLIAVGKSTASEVKLKLKFGGTELVDMSEKPFYVSEHVEGRVLYKCALPNTVWRIYAYGSELFCTVDDHIEVFDIFGKSNRQ
jgi:hypothetical protein